MKAVKKKVRDRFLVLGWVWIIHLKEANSITWNWSPKKRHLLPQKCLCNVRCLYRNAVLYANFLSFMNGNSISMAYWFWFKYQDDDIMKLYPMYVFLLLLNFSPSRDLCNDFWQAHGVETDLCIMCVMCLKVTVCTKMGTVIGKIYHYDSPDFPLFFPFFPPFRTRKKNG